MKMPPTMSIIAVVLLFSAAAIAADPVVARHTAIIKSPPTTKQLPTQGMSPGPLLGNGDVGVTLGGPPESQIFYISKNDFWRRNDASIVAIGKLTLSIPDLKGASFQQEQDMARAEVRGTFSKDILTVKTRSWVDANENLLVIEISSSSSSPLQVVLYSATGNEKLSIPGDVDPNSNTLFLARKAEDKPGARIACVASRFVAGGSVGETQIITTIAPGKTATIVTPILSDLDAKDPIAAAKNRAAELKPADVDALSKRHLEWWSAFWKKSFIEIPDKEIEKRWYAAQYIMGSCSREGKIPPGLWGNWITTDHPNWHGDFHTNYNFQGPYYILYSSNHTDTAMSFYPAMMDQIENGKKNAAKHGWKGIHFPVSLGPWGLIPEGEGTDWGQRSNAVFVAMNFIWQYQYTQDLDFAKKCAYPFCLEVADFWENYLKFEDGRYVIYDDAIHEGSGKDFNPLLSLGMVRTLFKNMLTMSADLGVDENRRAKWQDILEKLAKYPTMEQNGKTVFRYTEKGMKWNNGNTLGIHHIFPAGDIGLSSDPKLLETSRNMIDEMRRWSDGNGFCSWYTACARVGYDPKMILAKLRIECDKKSMPNLLLQYGGGGIENVGGFLAINEMMLQSHDETLRFFPCWPKDQDARFGTLRAVGAFLVSAEIKNGVISPITITSEKGKKLTLINPWPNRKVRITIEKNEISGAREYAGEKVSFDTSAGETLKLEPTD